ITGASRGIGKALAQRFAREGSNLVLCARTKNHLEQTKKECEKYNVRCIPVVADVIKKEDVKKVVQTALKTFGKIDLLINNAGFAVYKPLIETSEEELDKTLDVNVRGPFLFSKEVLPIMEKQKEGVIITVSSSSGKRGMEGLTVYCASKFAVEGFTQSLAQEVHYAKVCTVCPGPVNTPMYRDNSPGEDYSKIDQPEDIAERVMKIIQKGIENGASYNVWS
ncbi:MAG: SDR family oxidoreductase, partial [Nanoarchaeota archaeon]